MANCTNFTPEENWTFEEFHRYDYILCFLIIIGIVGNALIIFVQSRPRGTTGNGATNSLIIGLAFADLFTSVFLIPIPKLVNLPATAAGEFYCRLIEHDPLVWIGFMASVYTMTTISIERYLAIVHPFTYRVWIHKNRVKYAFVMIWAAAIAINFPSIICHMVNECGKCKSSYPSVKSRRVYGVFLFIFEYLGPLCVMSYVGTKSILTLYRSRLKFDGSNNPSGKKSRREQSRQLGGIHRRFTTMFTVIFVAFMVLWAPDQICFLLYNIGVLEKRYMRSTTYKTFLNIAFLTSTTANPIVYSVWLPSFRQALKSLVLCRSIGNSNILQENISVSNVTNHHKTTNKSEIFAF